MVASEYADPTGWCALGDLARLDDAGYLHLAGRLDEMINTGYHVYPGPIEEALRAIPGVLQTKVTGEPDTRTGELIAAYIVAAPNAEHLDEDRIRAALSTVLAPYKIPRRISIVDHIPGR
jgi:acyl-CoA synthetase (AMP-forming)/AMP-acid ligase II